MRNPSLPKCTALVLLRSDAAARRVAELFASGQHPDYPVFRCSRYDTSSFAALDVDASGVASAGVIVAKQESVVVSTRNVEIIIVGSIAEIPAITEGRTILYLTSGQPLGGRNHTFNRDHMKPVPQLNAAIPTCQFRAFSGTISDAEARYYRGIISAICFKAFTDEQVQSTVATAAAAQVAVEATA